MYLMVQAMASIITSRVTLNRVVSHEKKVKTTSSCRRVYQFENFEQTNLFSFKKKNPGAVLFFLKTGCQMLLF